MNTLYYGDNLPIMRQMAKDSVDLIYLDPPFNSKRTYNLMYKTMTGMPVPESVEAFFDTWELDAEKEQRARDIPFLMQTHGIDDYYVRFWTLWIDALRHTQPHLLAYLIYMVERLLHMRVILRPTGSIYLHCDPTASHYIKIMMDAIFGHQNFRNEIIWKRTSAQNAAKRWGPVHDAILFYSSTDKFTWNKTYQAYDEAYTARYKNKDIDGKLWADDNLTAPGVRHGDSGAIWRGYDPTAKGLHWKISLQAVESLIGPEKMRALSTTEKLDVLDTHGFIHWPQARGGTGGGFPRFKRYLSTGISIQDVIIDISPVNSQSKERLGYPTQKPVELLDRIIQASSNKGDIIFDPFCGCGTTIYSSIKNERRWIGCDIAILPIHLIKHVLEERYRLVEGAHFVIDGIPVSVEQAEALFHHDPFQFQHWLVERIGGFPMQKKVADRGIDGRLYFETRQGLKEMVLSVKGGGIHPTDVRDLRGVLERESSAELAGLLCLQEPTRGMREEAGAAGMYQYEGVHYPRIQLLTVREILEGKRNFHTPTKIGVRGATGQMSLRL